MRAGSGLRGEEQLSHGSHHLQCDTQAYLIVLNSADPSSVGVGGVERGERGRCGGGAGFSHVSCDLLQWFVFVLFRGDE